MKIYNNPSVSGQRQFSFTVSYPRCSISCRRSVWVKVARNFASQIASNCRRRGAFWKRLDFCRLLSLRANQVLIFSLLNYTYLILIILLQKLNSQSRPTSATTSYEDLSACETVELHDVPELPKIEEQRSTAGVRRLVRQTSVMDTQRDSDGTIKMTYWF